MLKPAPAPVTTAMILICEKCGKKLCADPDKNPSRLLQAELKEKIKSRYGKGVLRPIVTTCMDICPNEEVAIAISRTGEAPQFFTLRKEDLSDAAETLIDEAIQ